MDTIRKTLKSRLWVPPQHRTKILTLQALWSSLSTGTAKIGCLGRGKACGSPRAVCPPKRPRPFTHYRLKFIPQIGNNFFLDVLALSTSSSPKTRFGDPKNPSPRKCRTIPGNSGFLLKNIGMPKKRAIQGIPGNSFCQVQKNTRRNSA